MRLYLIRPIYFVSLPWYISRLSGSICNKMFCKLDFGDRRIFTFVNYYNKKILEISNEIYPASMVESVIFVSDNYTGSDIQFLQQS